MSNTISLRVSDNASFIMDKDNGFYPRKRTPVEQIIFVLSFVGFVGLGTSVIVYYDSLTGVYICGSLGIVLFFVGRQVEKVKLLLNVSEFMTALFSSALSKKYKFTAVVRLNGDVIYFNRSFQELFPGFVAQSNRSLEMLMTSCGASTDHIASALKALGQSSEARVSVILNTGEGKTPTPVALSFEPIERPTGFVLLRGE